MKRAGFGLSAAVFALGLASPGSAGTLTVGAGATLDLGTGSLALGCADLSVLGTLSAGTVGFQVARDVSIAPGGVVDGNSATLSLSGDWDNAGAFNAGTSTVQLVDGCGLFKSVVSGASTFANLSIGTTSSKLVSFTAGSVQTVTGLLTLLGIAGDRLQLRSTLTGTAAFLSVASNSADFVDVRDIDAQSGSNIWLSANSIKGPNTPGWVFGVPVPLLGPVALGALALALLASGQRRLVRERSAAGGGR